MDQILDTSELADGGKPSWIHSHLDAKLEKLSLSTEETSRSDITDKPKHRKIIPKYTFIFGKHFVGDCVEYEVELVESFKVFRKTITEKYKFKTRYSKLQSLQRNAKGKGFPPKKIFGNKNEQFIEQRKKLLEKYLNQLSKDNNAQLLNFVWQIKQAHLEFSYKQDFKLPF